MSNAAARRAAWVLNVATDENKLRAGAEAVVGSAVSLPIAGRVVGWAAGAGAGWLLTTGLGCAARPLENKSRVLAAGAGTGAAFVCVRPAGTVAGAAWRLTTGLGCVALENKPRFLVGAGAGARSTGSTAVVGLRVAGAAAGISLRPTETAGVGFRTTGAALAGGLALLPSARAGAPWLSWPLTNQLPSIDLVVPYAVLPPVLPPHDSEAVPRGVDTRTAAAISLKDGRSPGLCAQARTISFRISFGI